MAEKDTSAIYVSEEAYDHLVEQLTNPPKATPALRQLLVEPRFVNQCLVCGQDHLNLPCPKTQVT